MYHRPLYGQVRSRKKFPSSHRPRVLIKCKSFRPDKILFLTIRVYTFVPQNWKCRNVWLFQLTDICQRDQSLCKNPEVFIPVFLNSDFSWRSFTNETTKRQQSYWSSFGLGTGKAENSGNTTALCSGKLLISVRSGYTRKVRLPQRRAQGSCIELGRNGPNQIWQKQLTSRC